MVVAGLFILGGAALLLVWIWRRRAAADAAAATAAAIAAGPFDYVVCGGGPAGCYAAALLRERFPDKAICLVNVGGAPPRWTGWYMLNLLGIVCPRLIERIDYGGCELAHARQFANCASLGGNANINAGVCPLPTEQDVEACLGREAVWTYRIFTGTGEVDRVCRRVSPTAPGMDCFSAKLAEELGAVGGPIRVHADGTTRITPASLLSGKDIHVVRGRVCRVLLEWFEEPCRNGIGVGGCDGGGGGGGSSRTSGSVHARAVGVVVERGIGGVSTTFMLRTRRGGPDGDGEVLLCCGAIETPRLLIHSGVGPRDMVNKVRRRRAYESSSSSNSNSTATTPTNITSNNDNKNQGISSDAHDPGEQGTTATVLLELDRVGKDLQDHWTTRLAIGACPASFLRGYGLCDSRHILSHKHRWRDLSVGFGKWRLLGGGRRMVSVGTAARPLVPGGLVWNSRVGRLEPRLNFDAADRARFETQLQALRRTLWEKLGVELCDPKGSRCAVGIEARKMQPNWHFCGTACLGAVCEEDSCRVRGTANLRVADVSLLKTLPSWNTQIWAYLCAFVVVCRIYGEKNDLTSQLGDGGETCGAGTGGGGGYEGGGATGPVTDTPAFVPSPQALLPLPDAVAASRQYNEARSNARRAETDYEAEQGGLMALTTASNDKTTAAAQAQPYEDELLRALAQQPRDLSLRRRRQPVGGLSLAEELAEHGF